MTRQEIITELKHFFSIKDIVCQHTFAKFGEISWQFLDTEYLHTILIVRRDIVQAPMICNFEGHYQRGLRCNICQLVKDKTNENQIYLSAHCNGAGGDYSSTKMNAEQMRQKIKANAYLLPYNIRIEKGVSWLHLDCYDMGVKVYEFES